MDDKQIEITCPCCATRLSVDVRTGTVLRSRRKVETDETGKPKLGEADWSDAVGKVQRRTEGAPSKLEDALQKERDKRSRLEDLFSKANEKLKRKDEE